MQGSEIFAKEKISKILLRPAPPVMFAQLIQALYNIVDSLFVGRYSETGLIALSIIYPVQLLDRRARGGLCAEEPSGRRACLYRRAGGIQDPARHGRVQGQL